MKIREIIWDATTALVADTIALFSPQAANHYRRSREQYKRAYAAASTKGAYNSHKPTNKSGDAEVLSGQATVKARIRDMERNNPFVAGLILKGSTMVVGDEVGIKAQVLDKSGLPNKAVNAEIEKRFYRWAESASASGESLTECLYLIENHLRIDGEVLVKDVIETSTRGNPYRIQVLETDYLDPTKGDIGGYGIEYDASGKPKAFHIWNGHPGGLTVPTAVDKIPASDMVLLAETSRSSQRRGISPLASAVFKIYGIDDLEDAELVASRSACAFGLVIKSPMPDAVRIGGDSEVVDQSGNAQEFVGAGGILRLNEGEDAISFKSDRPNSNFDSFIRGRERKAASASGLSYETTTGDYSQVNYASARLARVIEWSVVRRRQNRLKKLLNQIYRKWLKKEIILVGIPGITASAYNADPCAYEAVSWQLSGNDGVDPVKEISAFESELALGVNSRTNWCAERGRDFSDIAKSISEEKETLKALGILEEEKKPAAAPMAQPDQEEPEEDEDEILELQKVNENETDNKSDS